MDNFKQALIQFAHSNPNFFQNNDTNFYSRLIEQRFIQFFPDFQTPNHPPYAAMIHKAIRELNKKGCSSEESISKYIKKEYVDLPWAHTTLLKHHLEKLCDSKEICMTHKQRYSLASADSYPISSSTSEKPLKRKRNSQPGKKNSGARKKRKKMKSRPDSEPSRNGKKLKKLKSKQDSKSGKKSRKHHKKKEKRIVDIQENNKQMIEVFQEDQDVQPLDEVADQQEVDLEIEDQSEKILSITHFDVIDNGNQSVEQHNEVNTSDVQIQEVNKDDEMVKGNQSVEQHNEVQMMQNLQLEQSPNSKRILQKNGKQIWTRSQLKAMSKKDALASSELTDPPSYEDFSEEKEHPMEIMDGKEAKQTPNAVSTQMNGQRAKLRSSQKNTVMESTDIEPQQKSTSPSLEKPLMEVDEPTQVQQAGSSEQDQQPEELKDETQENKPKKKGRKRHPKKSQQSAKKCKGGSRRSKLTLIENEGSGKSKAINKKDQLKNKRHKMTRRSSRKKRK